MPSAATRELPVPLDLSHHLSRTTRNREVSSIKGFYKYFLIPGIGQLAGGLPNQRYFPYDTLEAKTARPDRWKPTPNDPVDPPSTSSSSASFPSSHLVVPKSSGATDPLRRIDVKSALQYGTAQGYPALYSFLRQFTRENLHPNVPYNGGPEIILTCGNTDGFAKALLALNNEWSKGRDPVDEREGLLVEEYAYMNAVQAARPRGINIVPVRIDDEGMMASGKGGLQDVLNNWDSSQGKRPHLMYTVTIGQNPTSGVLSVHRRREIYDLCQRYDIIIMEDDPYWYLQFPSARNHRSSSSSTLPPPPHHSPPILSPSSKSSGYDFLDSLVPSYLSVDTDGRVLRLDTFSKTIAPGCRLGWITAQPALIERILRITETSTQQPSGFVQAMVAELIMGPQSAQDPGRGGARDGGGWEVDGWVRWLEGLRGCYERRMGVMCGILEEGKFLVKSRRGKSVLEADPKASEWEVVERVQMYDFSWPRGGMFVWIQLNLSTHPLHNKVEGKRLARALWILWTTKPFLVLATPGTIFAPTQEIREKSAWRFFRVCFAAVDEGELEPISRRMVEGFGRFWGIETAREIDEILRDDEGVAAGLGGVDLDDCAALSGFC